MKIKNKFLLVLFVLFSKVGFCLPKSQEIVFQKKLNNTKYNPTLNEEGRNYRNDEKFGYVLENTGNNYTQVYLEKKISAKEGTVSTWVKPLWQEDEKKSHTFFTLGWEHNKKSYMALSYGWWEPLGVGRLYFIMSNQESVHCSLPFKFDAYEWSLITAVWKSGSNGHCKIFIDGEKITEHQIKFKGNYKSQNNLFIGSDKGATENRNRLSDFLTYKINFYDVAFSDTMARELYTSQENDLDYKNRKSWKWMDSELNKKPRLRYNANGNLLESRIIFDEDMHWAYSKQNADRILSKIKEAGFNVYVPCVWHGNGTFYPSNITKPDPKLKKILESYDSLEYLIRRAHEMGIEVHPWFTVSRRENNEYPLFYDHGTPEGSYNVHKVEFREFITNVILEVVSKYDIDGINLDYIRTLGICTSDFCKKDYYKRNNSILMSDYVLRFIHGKARSRIQAWQDNAITEIVRNVSSKSREIKPNIIISVSGHPKPKNLIRPLNGRNSVSWANQDLIDVIFNMDYNKKINYENSDNVRKELKDKNKLIILYSNYDKINNQAVSRSGHVINNYVNYNRSKFSNYGIAFYIYHLLSNEQVDFLKKNSFAKEAKTIWPR